ncbi:hypothetical protein BDR06DRAFT_974662 [Suillus hirtellus]|nr:hypothetical protein BDR06DRAFT_974662 [Suillus hirtellus]
MKKATNKNIPGDAEDVQAHQPANLEDYCFATTSTAYWSLWEHWQIPYAPVNNLCRARRKSQIKTLLPYLVCYKELHLFEHKQQMLEYLEVFQIQPTYNANSRLTNYFSGSKSAVKTLQAFSSTSNPLAYADKSILGEIITEVFLDFCTCTRQKESREYLKTSSAICGSLNNTFKAATKATLTNKDRQKSRELKGRILSVLNEDNQIIL